MTPRARLLKTLAHEEPDRVPLHFRPGDPWLRQMIKDADLPPEVRDRFLVGDVDTLMFAQRGKPELFAAYHRDTPPAAAIDDWGIGELRHADSGETLLTKQVFYPFRGVHDPSVLVGYPWPDVTDPGRWNHLEGAVTECHRRGRPAIGQMSQTVAETAYGLCPPDQLFVDMYEHPEFVDALFQQILEIRCFQARTFAQAGVDVLRIGDDLATQRGLMISLGSYRRWFKPGHGAVIRAAREIRPDIPVLYHSDGDITDLLPDLVEIGVTAVNPVQPECMDPVEVKQRWAGKLTVWGAVGTQRPLAFGTEKEIDDEVGRLIARLAPRGGYVVNFINVAWSPRVRQNVLRYLLAVHERGVY